ncbi:MarR family transcriptional regulator [Nocardioides sp. dk4132]|uniref:MarR family winged helix-turn-helix transcriptional regulator n=1 Tax=unclassified Nocardioides TaxID=2615069 RepID=UPI001294E194|nr:MULTISPECIES: MarR family winged helix-turn-helix transcriptional regulator [unclassified Nocardioides]MQW78007.1 MarR family transcriptional regulator [Nocardioides sp. dk4132]QGA08115.1 MarR family transcriptional regulator [Nocardioides sp. dk884]
MSDPGAELYEVFRHIRPLHQLSARVVAAGLAHHDVSVPVRAVIEHVHDAGPRTVPQIARALWITRQGVQRLVDEGKERGYLEARPNPEHKRSHLIAASEAGRAVYESLHDEELTRLDRIAAGLDPGDIDACVRVLAHLVHELGALDALLTATNEGQ